MLRPLLFFDLAGTLEVRDPLTGLRGPWPEARAVLADLARTHDLHLTTGDSHAGATILLRELGMLDLFAERHAELPAGGKPFGALAAAAGRTPEACLAVGDSATADTAGDTAEVVSVIVSHRGAVLRPQRLAMVVRGLDRGGSFLAGFAAALAEVAGPGTAGGSAEAATRWAELPTSGLAGGCRLGWWAKAGAGPRPVVALGE